MSSSSISTTTNTTQPKKSIANKIKYASMSPISMFSASKAIINTLIRLLPIALYSGSVISGFVFNDFRATLLFLGFMINEGIALGYRFIMKGIYNPQCALLANEDDYFVLPSPITQTVGFFVGFFLAKMFEEGNFYPFQFFGYLVILLFTNFSTINIGCMGFLEALYCSLLGIILGAAYYNIVKNYFRRDFYNIENTDKLLNDFFDLK